MPYGMMKNGAGEWFTFNREYMPLGWNKKDYDLLDKMTEVPVYTKYRGLTDINIASLIKNENSINRDAEGKVTQFFFYNDATNPMNDPKHWSDYFDVIKTISKYKAGK